MDAVAPLLLSLAIILIVAKLGGHVAVRLGQPSVLGELLVGILIGTCRLGDFLGLQHLGSDEGMAPSSSTCTVPSPTSSTPLRASRATVLTFLKPKPGLYARLTEMHDCGLLGRMFPEFQAISCDIVRDFYHKYTVDEHTLLTIRNLKWLTAPSTPSPGSSPG